MKIQFKSTNSQRPMSLMNYPLQNIGMNKTMRVQSIRIWEDEHEITDADRLKKEFYFIARNFSDSPDFSNAQIEIVKLMDAPKSIRALNANAHTIAHHCFELLVPLSTGDILCEVDFDIY